MAKTARKTLKKNLKNTRQSAGKKNNSRKNNLRKNNSRKNNSKKNTKKNNSRKNSGRQRRHPLRGDLKITDLKNRSKK